MQLIAKDPNDGIDKDLHHLNRLAEEDSVSQAGVTKVNLDRSSIRQPDATRSHLSQSLLSHEGGASGHVCGLLCHAEFSTKIKFK